jgi:CheY-like chemotaxis protein
VTQRELRPAFSGTLPVVKVLLVEDDSVSRRLLRSYLENSGHDVIEAADGAAAWDLFCAGDFPIVVSDWMMPEMDGVELVRRIRAGQADRSPGYVYVILITAKTGAADVAEGVEAGADEFVRKPVDRDDLRTKLWEAERVVKLQEERQGP